MQVKIEIVEMKILSVEQIRQADAYTIEYEPVKSIDLMERAAVGCCEWITERFDIRKKIIVFCGLGNNGGDGLVIARLLSEKNYEVEVYTVRYSTNLTDDFKINYERLAELSLIKIFDIGDGQPLPKLNQNDLIIDALIGSGLSKPIKGFLADVVRHINQSGSTVISIDIPSGLFGDKEVTNDDAVINANYTLTFQFSKFSFLFPENYPIKINFSSFLSQKICKFASDKVYNTIKIISCQKSD